MPDKSPVPSGERAFNRLMTVAARLTQPTPRGLDSLARTIVCLSRRVRLDHHPTSRRVRRLPRIPRAPRRRWAASSLSRATHSYDAPFVLMATLLVMLPTCGTAGHSIRHARVTMQSDVVRCSGWGKCAREAGLGHDPVALHRGFPISSTGAVFRSIGHRRSAARRCPPAADRAPQVRERRVAEVAARRHLAPGRTFGLAQPLAC